MKKQKKCVTFFYDKERKKKKSYWKVKEKNTFPTIQKSYYSCCFFHAREMKMECVRTKLYLTENKRYLRKETEKKHL